MLNEAAAGLTALKGHRSDGEVLANGRNAWEPGGVTALVRLKGEYERHTGTATGEEEEVREPGSIPAKSASFVTFAPLCASA